MGIGEMTILENGFCHYPDFVEAGLLQVFQCGTSWQSICRWG